MSNLGHTYLAYSFDEFERHVATVSVGRRIREARERRGWTQHRLATVVGVHVRERQIRGSTVRESVTVAGWEKGRALPTSQRLDLVAEALGVSRQWLLEGSGERAA